MRKFFLLTSLFIIGGFFYNCMGQMVNSQSSDGDRIAQARESVGTALTEDLAVQRLQWGAPIYLRVFKSEQELEIWIQDSTAFRLFRTYPICRVPGLLGPKRKEGDLQVPEGLYWIEVFNPKSTYHLSLGINYPNASDRILADPKTPGGEIYIHGDCVSVGCIPITDEKIREVYLLALEAKNAGQNQIPVHIFGRRSTRKNGDSTRNHSTRTTKRQRHDLWRRQRRQWWRWR
jgi:murein L,D-transpeptidase YafK